MSVAAAHFTFFLDVGDLAAGRHFAVAADHASTSERREPQETNETHGVLRLMDEQTPCRGCVAASARARARAVSTHIDTTVRQRYDERRPICACEWSSALTV